MPSGAPAPTSRLTHGRALQGAFESAVAEGARRRADAKIRVSGVAPGLYVEFESAPGVALELSQLEAGDGVELVSVTRTTGDRAPRTERATVFVPEGQVRYFITRFETYANDTPKQLQEVRHESLFDPIGDIRLATFRAFFTDDPAEYPEADQAISWEVWLRRTDGRELERMRAFAAQSNIRIADQWLAFDDRIVALVRASATELASSIDVLSDLAEVRRAKELASAFTTMDATQQAEWVNELRARTTPPSADAPAICVFDTGVNRGHPLLEMALAPEDCHACHPAWGTHDHEGHGTEMAGLVLYGDLAPVLADAHAVELRHRLESVKLLPPIGENDEILYGAVTAEGVGRAEISAPDRRRAFAMAIGAPGLRDRGQPTSWSAAIDALACGRSFDSTSRGLVYFDDIAARRRLFILSAGNVSREHLQVRHLERSDVDVIHDPGQAWNALTVGAFTNKAVLSDKTRVGWRALAEAGELSPWSTTGGAFAETWPIKPDVVFEGGNVAVNASNEIDFGLADLSLLTTSYRPSDSALSLTWATSAAMAQAARMAAMIAAEYPSLGPEAVRALMVHSARWTPRMKKAVMGAGSMTQRARLVRRYGFGVPRLDRATRSASDSLTLIAEGAIRPFKNGEMREMHLFELPWPRDALLELGEARVHLRITLSYFVEPNPARCGWRRTHRYASHGLRFDLKSASESVEEFRKRINKRALDEGERRPSAATSKDNWLLGEKARNRGSLHSDILKDVSAVDLADRNVIGISPVTGWWKELPKRDRSEKGAPYALIVSIEAPRVDTDIWTPVAEQIGVLVPVQR